MAILRCDVERSYALPVSAAAESGFVIDGRAVIDQPLGRFQAVAHCGPDQWCPAIGVGVQTGACANEPGKYLDAAALAGPNKSFVQNLLRIGRWLPIREPAVRPVESSPGTSFERKSSFASEAFLHKVLVSQPG